MKGKKINLWVMAFAMLGIVSCSSDDDQGVQSSTLTLQSRTVIDSETESPSVVGGANLLNATVRVENISIIGAGNTVASGTAIGTGVQELTLLNSGLPSQGTTLGSAMLQHGEYDRVSLRLNRGLGEDNGNSIFITGTVNGMILNISTDSQEIFTRNITGGAYTHNSSGNLYLEFDINALLAGIDLKTAVDGDEDGIIEIDSDNTDDNREIFTRMVTNLPNAIRVVADQD